MTPSTTRCCGELRALEAEHPELVTPDSPTQTPWCIKARPRRPFAAGAPTSRQMLSLDNAFTRDELVRVGRPGRRSS